MRSNSSLIESACPGINYFLDFDFNQRRGNLNLIDIGSESAFDWIGELDGISAGGKFYVDHPGLVIIPGKGISEVHLLRVLPVDPDLRPTVDDLVVVRMPAAEFSVGKMNYQPIDPTSGNAH